jgi:transcriptional enhancer factor
VLISIADGRLPDERPNYEYFSRLLNAESDVFIRPKQCWIFVSSSKIGIKEKHVASDDGTMKKQITGHHPDGLVLTEADYPHLKLNDSKDYKDLPRQGNHPTVLLHEYTRSLAQKESSSVKEISSKWDVRFPELREKLTAALDATQPSDERTSRCVVGPCDTFHFEVVLDLHSTSKFPPGSDLNGLVEFTISRPDLHNHSWRSKTSVIKPDELYMTDVENDYWDQTASIDIIPSHRVGCTGVGQCDCTSRGSRDTISIPFPANSWANTFIKLAPFVTAERERKGRERAAREAVSLNGRAEREAARLKKENEEASSHLKAKGPSPKDLLAQVAMYQEIWSAPRSEVANRSSGDDSSPKRSRGAWTRRAVILWTFVPVHDSIDEKGKVTVVPPGSNWRFLTKIDPTSSYHQQQAYVSSPPTVLSRDNVMSPNPVYAHHINAAMHENFSAAYGGGSTTTFSLPSHTHSHNQQHLQHLHQQHQLTGLGNVLDGYSNGLATPPPTATLSNSYAHSFDGNSTHIDSGHALHHHLSFMSDGTSGTSATDHSQASLITSSGPDATDAFLSGLDVSDYIPDFHTTSTTHNLGDLTTRYLDNSHSIADAGSVSWAETGALTASSTAEPQWAAIAAAAAAVAGHTQHHIGHSPHETHTDLSPIVGHQDTWEGWQAAEFARMTSNYSRRASTSLWDEAVADMDDNEATTTFSLGGTGLTPLRNHTHSQARSLTAPGQKNVLTSHTTQQQQQHSPTVAGRKRSRTESVGLDIDDDDECEGYPVHSIRKLAHHPASTSISAYATGHESPPGSGGAPTAVMDDEQGNYL